MAALVAPGQAVPDNVLLQAHIRALRADHDREWGAFIDSLIKASCIILLREDLRAQGLGAKSCSARVAWMRRQIDGAHWRESCRRVSCQMKHCEQELNRIQELWLHLVRRPMLENDHYLHKYWDAIQPAERQRATQAGMQLLSSHVGTQLTTCAHYRFMTAVRQTVQGFAYMAPMMLYRMLPDDHRAQLMAHICCHEPIPDSAQDDSEPKASTEVAAYYNQPRASRD